MIDIVEHERCGLIDRRGASAGGRIGLRAGMNGQRVEARIAFAIVHDEAALSRIRVASLSGARARASRRASSREILGYSAEGGWKFIAPNGQHSIAVFFPSGGALGRALQARPIQ